ncbi:patatin-like phospholipase family protein [Syntrophomonas curvata]
MKKLGLALGGGGLKGLAHIGILQVLEDNRIPVSMVSGTSSGSIMAALYASGLSPYSMEEEVLKLKPGDYLDYNISGLIRYLLSCFIPTMGATLDGIIKGDRLEKLIFHLTGGKYLQDSKLPLAIIACDIDSGREIIFSGEKIRLDDNDGLVVQDALLSQAVRASISIPATFVPSHLQGMQLVDGGVRSMVPVAVQKLLGAEYVLAVNLGQYIYDQGVQGIPEIVNRALNILGYETSATEEKIFADMSIYPDVSEVRLSDLDKAAEIIRIGRRTMKKEVAKLKRNLLA